MTFSTHTTAVYSPYFRAPYAWRPGASEEQLKVAAQMLGITWPEDLKTLYLQHDGVASQRWVPDWEDQWQDFLEEDEDARPQVPFLMSLAEAAQWYANTQELFPEALRFFWTDDNSNYVGVYLQGPLKGMVCVFTHADGSFVPTFRTVQDFLNWVCAHPMNDVFEESGSVSAFPSDVPDPIYDEEDWAKAQNLYKDSETEEDNPRLACVMALTPYARSEVLMPYLQHS